ncbi:hypothetical protein GCK72_004950 [Caenorhabditis remanei]|uniref:Uncharacterized protein n=1 Tax=Caenorhabditis remanei TaxID=31234 RepID=A0A6A5HDA0_CAERE|nr:hypothetical protein GCK72_004950 [Caenorhabditis remanei]KAF1764999.1 hypothetical protein GCK72_004950 [Caenorhabditis remanei]
MGNGSVVYSGDHHTLDFGFNGMKRFSEDLIHRRFLPNHFPEDRLDWHDRRVLVGHIVIMHDACDGQLDERWLPNIPGDIVGKSIGLNPVECSRPDKDHVSFPLKELLDWNFRLKEIAFKWPKLLLVDLASFQVHPKLAFGHLLELSNELQRYPIPTRGGWPKAMIDGAETTVLQVSTSSDSWYLQIELWLVQSWN